MTKVRVHVASICGSWETEPLLLEQARAYGQQLKKKQPLHSVTLRGFADGHFEEIPKQEKRKVRNPMGYRRVSGNIEAWAPPLKGKILEAEKFSEKVINDQTVFVVRLIRAYECVPAGEGREENDDGTPKLELYEPGAIVGVSAISAFSELHKYERIKFMAKFVEKKKMKRGSVWIADVGVDDDGAVIKTGPVRAEAEKRATKPTESESSSKSDDDDIPF